MLVLLRLLQDGRFHSGEELGALLGVSRSAVWKRLQAFEMATGYEVFRVPGKGYRLASPPQLLDSVSICAAAQNIGWAAVVLDGVDSTNAVALRMLGEGVAAPFVVTAEQQSAGRGRRGRDWISPLARNLYLTLAVRVEGGVRQLEALSLSVGLAVAAALVESGLEGVELKWPNDVLVRGKKIAGILLEVVGDPADSCCVVIGVGLNVNMEPGLAVEISQPWTSICAESGADVSRTELCIQLFGQLSSYLHRHFDLGFSALKMEWERYQAWRGADVLLTAGAQSIQGSLIGVDDHGALRLIVEGVEQAFSGGELSLRLNRDY